MDSNGCVQARTDGGVVSLVWPQGYTVRGDASSFEVLDASGTPVIGSEPPLAIGGGYADSSRDTWDEDECVTDDLWMVGEIVDG